MFVAVYDANGEYERNNWDQRDEAELPAFPATFTQAQVTALNAGRYVTFPLPDADGASTFRAVAALMSADSHGTLVPIVIAISSADTERLLGVYLTIFLGFGLGVVLVGALLTRMLVTSTFTPLREVERTAAAIADGDFGQRLGGATPNTEVGRLNRSLNTMLNRIDRAFRDRARTIDQMRRFVGDASHELRTPLVSVRGYAELYRMGALQTDDDVAQAMERIEKEAIRMGGLVEDLLALARLDEAKPLELAQVDLVPLARDAALDTMAAHPDRVVTVIAPEHGATDVPGDTAPELEVELDPASRPAAPPISFAGATLARLRGRRVRGDAAVGPPRRAGGQAGGRGIRRREARRREGAGRPAEHRRPVGRRDDRAGRERSRRREAVGEARAARDRARRGEQDPPGHHESHGQRDPVHLRWQPARDPRDDRRRQRTRHGRGRRSRRGHPAPDPREDLPAVLACRHVAHA